MQKTGGKFLSSELFFCVSALLLDFTRSAEAKQKKCPANDHRTDSVSCLSIKTTCKMFPTCVITLLEDLRLFSGTAQRAGSSSVESNQSFRHKQRVVDIKLVPSDTQTKNGTLMIQSSTCLCEKEDLAIFGKTFVRLLSSGGLLSPAVGSNK